MHHHGLVPLEPIAFSLVPRAAGHPPAVESCVAFEMRQRGNFLAGGHGGQHLGGRCLAASCLAGKCAQYRRRNHCAAQQRLEQQAAAAIAHHGQCLQRPEAEAAVRRRHGDGEHS